MDDVPLMTIADCVDKLTKERLCPLLAEAARVGQKIKQLAIGAVFGDNKYGGLGGEDFKQSDDVGMTKLAVVVDLTGHQGSMLLADLFDSDSFAGDLMDA